MGADSDASPGDRPTSPDPEPYSEHADEHPEGILRSADPSWPARVRDTWESFRQARAKLSGLLDALDELEEEKAARHSTWIVGRQVEVSLHQADVAYLAYINEWYDWQPRPETSADYEDPEAGW
jgi:hypothetical protein